MGEDTDLREDVSAVLGRAAILRELARALDYPSSEARADIGGRWHVVLAAAAGWPEGVRPALIQALERLDGADASLESEHVRLFGPAGRASLTETSYGDAGRLLGKSAALADVGGFYRAFGLKPGTEHPRPEDHLAFELEFLSVLAVKEAWAMSEGDEEALEVTRDATGKFLSEHLGTWIDAWLAVLRASDPPPFYDALGEVIQRLVRAECARLAVEPRTVGSRVVDRAVGDDVFTCPRAVTS
jgi:TorA maturation chaperone TorD